MAPATELDYFCAPGSARGLQFRPRDACHVAWPVQLIPMNRRIVRLEGLGSIQSQAFNFFDRGSYCKEIKWLELSASLGS